MEKTVDHVRLVKRAKLGDKESLDRLTELAVERLRVDIFRLTLREDLAEDVVQETLFEMLRVLKDLKDAHRFWPWLYKIALNKVRQHYRVEKRRQTVTVSAAEQKDSQRSSEHVMAEAISRELRDIVLGAMRRLKPRQRAILTMRCYREMGYSQIAESMGCSEFAAKMLFYRAKKSLRKQLSRFGFGKSLLPALVLFGKLTARSEAAAVQVTVSAASVKVGAAAGLVGFASSKTGIVSLAAAGVLAVGTTVISSLPEHGGAPGASQSVIGSQTGGLRAGVEEYCCYYPQSASGPVMMQLLRWDSREKRSYCQWLQNEQATYYFDKGKDTVYVKNHRMWRDDLSVWRLPTDGPEFREFLSRVEGAIDDSQYVRGRGAGLLVKVRRDEEENHSRVTHHSNVLGEQYFLYNWPTRTQRIDSRDAMHKRGWTYFNISGRIGEDEVTGTGRIPFVDGKRRQFGPWIKLEVGGNSKLVDNGAEARVYDRAGRLAARYKGGSFFAGLGKQWMGLHTIDTVRRDAAREQIWFETELNARKGKAEVVLTRGQAKVTYTIDMDRDVVEKIRFLTGNGVEGELRFSYLDEVGPVSEEYVLPRWRSSERLHRESPGMLWLVKLVNGEL